VDVSLTRSGLKRSSRIENFSGCCLPLFKMNKSKILALKYRPQDFKDLIGQEIMAQTIINSIKLGKTPNAYLLTGIRGVGKTTTARLIAKALNCEKNLDEKIKCSQSSFCSTCSEIVNSSHIDILEMDAASKTGIDDVRELIENSKYSPTSAKFKIFIIDEVHMLSKQAFNGLLKTLEEPPPSLKFILATTEVRKIPVTILSRCQRFDLKRVELDKLVNHLREISKKENGKISGNALRLIARTSEGSVRDSISLLDKALITQSIKQDKEIDEIDIREMLGLADRNKLIQIFQQILNGDEKKAIIYLRELINSGLDSKNFLNDILEILYLFSRRINLGPIEKDLMISESELEMINKNSKSIDMQDIGIFWQLTIKTIDDLKIVSNENLMLEMYIMQLVHIKNIEKPDKKNFEASHARDSVEEKKIFINDKNESTDKSIPNRIKKQLKSTNQIDTKTLKHLEIKADKEKLLISSFQDLIRYANIEKEVELKYDLERNVRLVSFNKGKIDISFNEKLNKHFVKVLTEKLLLWTGERWIISLSKEKGDKTIFEKNLENKIKKMTELKNSEVAKEIFSVFSDAEIVETKDKDE
jgi:DNA polymerase-3 subunit gamma/tau|tara:strand:+ start:33 stop:1796 length:1764 start_codon:yes stop_codon:yes gene_type:complete